MEIWLTALLISYFSLSIAFSLVTLAEAVIIEFCLWLNLEWLDTKYDLEQYGHPLAWRNHKGQIGSGWCAACATLPILNIALLWFAWEKYKQKRAAQRNN